MRFDHEHSTAFYLSFSVFSVSFLVAKNVCGIFDVWCRLQTTSVWPPATAAAAALVFFQWKTEKHGKIVVCMISIGKVKSTDLLI